MFFSISFVTLIKKKVDIIFTQSWLESKKSSQREVVRDDKGFNSPKDIILNSMFLVAKHQTIWKKYWWNLLFLLRILFSQLETLTRLSQKLIDEQKIRKNVVELNIINQLHIIDISRIYFTWQHRKHMLLKLSWNIQQDRAHSSSWNMSTFKELEIIVSALRPQ